MKEVTHSAYLTCEYCFVSHHCHHPSKSAFLRLMWRHYHTTQSPHHSHTITNTTTTVTPPPPSLLPQPYHRHHQTITITTTTTPPHPKDPYFHHVTSKPHAIFSKPLNHSNPPPSHLLPLPQVHRHKGKAGRGSNKQEEGHSNSHEVILTISPGAFPSCPWNARNVRSIKVTGASTDSQGHYSTLFHVMAPACQRLRRYNGK